MPTTDVTFGPGGIIRHEAPTVYTAARWADDWTLDESLTVTDVSWSCMPTMPVANLTLHYGRVRWFGSDAWVEQAKLTGMARRYVKIVVPMEDDGAGELNTKEWYGIFQLTIDEQNGATFEKVGEDKWEVRATGTQQLVAYGMESLLNLNVMSGSVFEFEGGIGVTAEIVPFNRRGNGNRSANKYSGSNYIFADVLSGAPNWSTRDIVEYLLAVASPRDAAGTVLIPFAIAAGATLPTWDNPQLNPAEQTAYGVLQRIVSRQRLLSAWFEVDGDTVKLHTETLTPNVVNLSIPGAVDATIPANASQLRIICDEDQATTLAVKDTEIPVYDVVIARGGPEICVGSFSFADGTVEANWNNTEQTGYEAAASGQAGYIALGLKQQLKANAAVRSSAKFDKVFSYFQIPRTWNQKVKNGENAGGENWLFPATTGGRNQVYWPAMFVENSLPLLLGADYADGRIASKTTGETADMRERLPLLVFLKDPQDSRWIRAEEIGNLADLEVETAGAFAAFTLHAHVPPESHGFVLRVAGAPQHALGYGDFTPLSVDADAGRWSYSSAMVATLAIPSGSRVQGQWPTDAPADVDAVRYYFLDVGDNMEAVYVAPGTVVGVKPDGTLQRSDGGWIYRPTNAVEHLTALAKIASAWYSIPHHVVTIETQRLTTEIGLGDLIARIGDERGGNKHQLDANAPVTEIRVSWPLSQGDEPGMPTMTVQTFAGELDPIQVQPRQAPANTFVSGAARFKEVPHVDNPALVSR
jgi:hypothetical protein